jgi:hypothetical protein
MRGINDVQNRSAGNASNQRSSAARRHCAHVPPPCPKRGFTNPQSLPRGPDVIVEHGRECFGRASDAPRHS